MNLQLEQFSKWNRVLELTIISVVPSLTPSLDRQLSGLWRHCNTILQVSLYNKIFNWPASRITSCNLIDLFSLRSEMLYQILWRAHQVPLMYSIKGCVERLNDFARLQSLIVIQWSKFTYGLQEKKVFGASINDRWSDERDNCFWDIALRPSHVELSLDIITC